MEGGRASGSGSGAGRARGNAMGGSGRGGRVEFGGEEAMEGLLRRGGGI